MLLKQDMEHKVILSQLFKKKKSRATAKCSQLLYYIIKSEGFKCQKQG